MNSVIKLIVVVAMALFIGACGSSEYEQLVKSELASGVRNDSLVFGIYFGDTSKEFFARCWELNKTGIISHGAKNMNVKYTIKVEDGSDIDMLFYPVLDDEGKIRKMDLEFNYQGWAPWNDQYQADRLMPVVQDYMEDWYPGNPFMQVDVEEETYWVKVDGNRKIIMKSNGQDIVLVRMVDLLNKDN